MNTKVKNTRIEYIDVLKFFAIFTVVFGHVILNYGRDRINDFGYSFILPFHMPLFAFVSGLFIKENQSVSSFLKSKFRSIFLPYFTWCAIVHVIVKGGTDYYHHIVYGSLFYFKPLLICFWNALIDWGWWFLRALFISHFFLFFFLKLFRNKILIGAVLSIIVLYSCSFFGILPNKHPFFIGFIFLYPFLLSGMLFKKYYSVVERYENKLFLLSFMIFGVCVYFWGGLKDSFYSMNTSILETTGVYDIAGVQIIYKTLFRFITGLSGSIFFVLLFKKLKYSQALLKIVLPIGANTLGIYILHSFVFDFIDKIFYIESNILLFVFCIFFSFVIILMCYLVIRVTDNFKYLSLLLFGKKN